MQKAARTAALGFVGLTIAVAAGADLLARSTPLIARIQGALRFMPDVWGAATLPGPGLESLEPAPGDWMVRPLVPWDPNQQDKGHRAVEPPSRRHWLGTDTARRDVLSRLIHGARVTVMVGLGAVALYATIGVLLGVIAGYFGGFVDALICRLIEVLLSVPTFFLLLAVMGLTEGGSTGLLVAVFGLVSWTRIARLTRAEARRLRHLEFIEAARALGLSPARVLLCHVLPNSLAPAIVSASFGVAATILSEASLSFLGFGVPDHVASWGGIMHGALRDFGAWWLMVFPGLALFATVAAYNVLGDLARDRLDPRLQRQI